MCNGKPKELTEADVEITIYTVPDDSPVRGNAYSGDPDEERRIEDEILERLHNNDQWAWCTVEVRARDPHTGLEAADYLGACSYADEQGFKEGGYYDDMVANAIAELNAERMIMYRKLIE